MIFAANFKANHTSSITNKYIQTLSSLIEGKLSGNSVVVFPPFTAISQSAVEGITIGAQNGYPAEKGSYTGEICLEQLSDIGIDTILIGHSERRHILKEPQDFIVRKFDFFKRQNFNIYYCIGEPIEVRQKGLEAVLRYIDEQLEGIDLDYEHLVVAYEPVWAIGTGISADIEDIDDTHRELKKKISAPLLYGGSVNASNAKAILSSEHVDGVLVGNFSLKADDFATLLDYSKN